MRDSSRRIVVVCLVVLVFGALSASGQWIAGVKFTPTVVDTVTLQVDGDATVFYDTGVGFSSAFLGVSSGFGTIAPALDWGDGSSVAPYFPTGSGIPFDTTSTPPGASGPVRAYRMAFSHVYGAAAQYTVTVNSHFTGGISSALVFTGTTTTAPTPSYATFGGIQTFVQNTTTVDLAPLVPVIEIPTASETGLLLLALVMGAAGVFFLRR